MGKTNVNYIHIYIYLINNLYLYLYMFIHIYNFEVTMGSYDRAEVCTLSSVFMLSLIGNKYNSNNIGLYRDDGLGIFKNTSSRPQSE